MAQPRPPGQAHDGVIDAALELVVDGSEREPGFATLEVDPAPEPDWGSLGSVSIEARGVTVRLDGDIGAGRIAAIASALRALR